jgi:hypothetical protein
MCNAFNFLFFYIYFHPKSTKTTAPVYLSNFNTIIKHVQIFYDEWKIPVRLDIKEIKKELKFKIHH